MIERSDDLAITHTPGIGFRFKGCPDAIAYLHVTTSDAELASDLMLHRHDLELRQLVSSKSTRRRKKHLDRLSGARRSRSSSSAHLLHDEKLYAEYVTGPC